MATAKKVGTRVGAKKAAPRATAASASARSVVDRDQNRRLNELTLLGDSAGHLRQLSGPIETRLGLLGAIPLYLARRHTLALERATP